MDAVKYIVTAALAVVPFAILTAPVSATEVSFGVGGQLAPLTGFVLEARGTHAVTSWLSLRGTSSYAYTHPDDTIYFSSQASNILGHTLRLGAGVQLNYPGIDAVYLAAAPSYAVTAIDTGYTYGTFMQAILGGRITTAPGQSAFFELMNTEYNSFAFVTGMTKTL